MRTRTSVVTTQVEITMGDLMKPEELAQRWGVAVKSLANQRSRGEGPPFLRLSGGVIRYSRRVIAEYEAARIVSPGGDAA